MEDYNPYRANESQGSDERVVRFSAPLQNTRIGEPDVLESMLSEDVRKGIEKTAFHLGGLAERKGIHSRQVEMIEKDILHWSGRMNGLSAPAYNFERAAEVDKQKMDIEKQIQELRREKRKLESERWKDALSLVLALPELLAELRGSEQKQKFIVSDW